jgi:predicted dehydrogenase
LHYEWAVRSIRAGKHVLLEKPCVSNSVEAEILFNLPELSQPKGPVLLEAFHVRFFPSWQYFQSLIEPADVEHVYSQSMIPWWGTSKDAIFFNYSLSGGCIMSMGTYNMAALRLVFGAEPVECLSCEANTFPEKKYERCDTDFKAKFRFPNGGIGECESTLRGNTVWLPSSIVVTNREVIVPDRSLPRGQEKVLKRELSLHGILFGLLWHRIEIKDTYAIRANGKVIKTWKEKTTRKAYTFEEVGGKFAGLPSETYWLSFRHVLEQFVNKVKGRETQTWVTGEDSIAQMKMVDMAYEKSGLGIRPTSEYR